MAFDDPNSSTPLLDMMTRAVMNTVDAAVNKGMEMAGNLKDATLNAASTVAAKTADIGLTGRPSTPGTTVKEEKELAMAQQQDIKPPIPEQVQGAAMAAVTKSENMKPDVQETTLSEAMGKQVVAASVPLQTQALGLG